jgi:hypothetical protein
MASRFYSRNPQRGFPRRARPDPPGKGGKPGAEAAGVVIRERTAAWPTAGAQGKTGFAAAAAAQRWPVAKVYATSAGLAGKKGGDIVHGRRLVRHSPALIMPGEILPEQEAQLRSQVTPSWSVAPPIGAPSWLAGPVAPGATVSGTPAAAAQWASLRAQGRKGGQRRGKGQAGLYGPAGF